MIRGVSDFGNRKRLLTIFGDFGARLYLYFFFFCNSGIFGTFSGTRLFQPHMAVTANGSGRRRNLKNC